MALIDLSSKILKIFSKDITESSSDGLRLALGTYYQAKPESTTDETAGTSYEFPVKFDGPYSDDSVTFDDRPYNVYEAYDLADEYSMRALIPEENTAVVRFIETNPTRITKINSNSYVPNFKIPIRLYADPNAGIGDQFWNTFFMGGTYADNLYPKLFNEEVYYDTEIVLRHPYHWKTAKYSWTHNWISNWWVQPIYNDYDQYVQEYQDWSKTQDELLLPNYSFAISAFLDPIDDADYSPAGRQRKLLMNYYYPLGEVSETEEPNKWCGRDWLAIEKDAELKNNVINAQKNLIFDSNYFVYYQSHGGADAPYYNLENAHFEALTDAGVTYDASSNMYSIKISFTRNESVSQIELPEGALGAEPGYQLTKPILAEYDLENPSSFLYYGSITPQNYRIRNTIEANDFSSKFLEILKDLDDGTITDIPYRTTEYAIQNISVDPEENKRVSETSMNRLKTFDWMQFLLYTYNEYDAALNDNYSFMGPVKSTHDTTYTDSTLYRFSDNQNVLKVLDKTVDIMQQYFHILIDAEKEPDWYSTHWLEFEYKAVSKPILANLLAPVEKNSEVLAYKIEKYGGTPTGDSSSQNLIQKFWLYNSKDAPLQMRINDTQVKYGERYTYKVYAYVSVMSHKYKYSDFRLTKQIGVHEAVEDDPETEGDESEPTKYCLQFYDPVTNEAAEQIFRFVPEESIEDYAVWETTTLSKLNSFSTNGIDISISPQLADFNLNIEPCVKILEVPLFEKTVSVLDSPPNPISAVPFHFIDDSKRVGFNLFSEGWNSALPYPTTITDKDTSIKEGYLHGRDLRETDSVYELSQSPARYIEIFRSSKKPTSFTDFDGLLVSRIDLRVPNEEFNRSDFIAADEVNVNKKYYYVFRFVNENGIPGPLSAIIEAELNDEGGYIYSLFDVLNTSDFKVDPYVVNSTPAKKIFQLEPSIQQVMFDTKKVDFSNYAKDEVDNVQVGMDGVETVFGKKFKIRLTSKKTQKKLDINVTYNLRTKDLSPDIVDLAPDTDITSTSVGTDLEDVEVISVTAPGGDVTVGESSVTTTAGEMLGIGSTTMS